MYAYVYKCKIFFALILYSALFLSSRTFSNNVLGLMISRDTNSASIQHLPPVDQTTHWSTKGTLATKFLQCHYKYIHDTYEYQVTVFIQSRALCAAALLGRLVEATSSVSSTSLLLSSFVSQLFTTWHIISNG